jgi:outer membrane protein OmpA-like peptidoglycan-associated protein
MKKTILGVVAVLALLVAATGCATKKYVRGETEAVQGQLSGRIDDVQGQVEQTQSRLDQHDQDIQRVGGEAQTASRTAQEALTRAQEAGKLAQGKFLYEAVLTDDKVKFPVDRATLSPEATAALDEFAARIKGENKNVYVEIQGHTDSTGSEPYNERLGQERAGAVQKYLNQQHGFPLHRMNVISYGESSPIADNGNREGRAQNRRVNLVVLE